MGAGTLGLYPHSRRDLMAKGQVKQGKDNKPKLSTKDKQKKKKEKEAKK